MANTYTHTIEAQQNVLIVGNGGREYALGEHLKRDKRIKQLFFASGNAGTARLGENVAITHHQDIIRFCKQTPIDWVIIGAETLLVEGLSDELRNEGIKVFGPSKSAARLEGSKAFMKDFLKRHNIPTARYVQTNDLKEAIDFAYSLTPPIVIKASGLCAGKGVLIAKSYEDSAKIIKSMLSGDSFGEAGERIVIEEFLDGFELSVFGICDGKHFILLPPCQDHKRLYDNDEGPNTGGMGAYAPTPLCNKALLEKISHKIFEPTLRGMSEEGNEFCGVLFAGIMVVKEEKELKPYLLEFNVRFGDPECEVLMPLLRTPLLDICEAVESKSIDNIEVRFSRDYCVGVVLASANYPFGASVATPITINDFDERLGSICYAGVSNDKNGTMLASGGRVVLAIGKSSNLRAARDNAYIIVKHIDFAGRIYREDIAGRALGEVDFNQRSLDCDNDLFSDELE